MADSRNAAQNMLILYYMDVPSGKGQAYAIQNADPSVKAVTDIFGVPYAAIERHMSDDKDEGDAIDEAMKDPFYLNIQPVERFIERYRDPEAKSEGDKFLSMFLGKEFHYSLTLEGFGFYLDSAPRNFARFVKAHAESILTEYNNRPQEYDKLAAIINGIHPDDNPEDVAAKFDAFTYETSCDRGEGWQLAISTVMRRETGFDFTAEKHSKDDSFPGLSDKDCIIITDDDYARVHIQRETLVLTVCRYAKELDISKFGDIMFTFVATSFRKPHTYTVRTDTGVDEESEPDGDEIVIVLVGDSNLNGKLTLADLVCLSRYFGGRYELREYGELAADVDLDGNPTDTDLICLSRYFGGEFTPSWRLVE